MEDEEVNKEPQMVRNIRRYALIYGAGGVAALQALKMDLFQFPPTWPLYLSYFFSVITIFCIFLGAPSVGALVKRMNEVIKKMSELDKKEMEEKRRQTSETP
jgi:hypothetical protein